MENNDGGTGGIQAPTITLVNLSCRVKLVSNALRYHAYFLNRRVCQLSGTLL